MKVKFDQKTLKAALLAASQVADPKSPNPALASVYLEVASNDSALICATDNIVSLTQEVPCEAEELGTVVTNAKDLAKLVAQMPSGEVNLSTVLEMNCLVVEAGRSKYSLRVSDPELYPDMPDHTSAEFGAIDARELRTLFDRTGFSTCKDVVRMNLTGVFFQSDGDRIRCVSTDGYRLSKSESPQTLAKNEGVIVPMQGVKELKKLLAGSEIVHMAIGAGIVFLTVNNPTPSTLAIRTIEGEYPDYAGIIPTDNFKSVKLEKGLASAAFSRLKFLTGDDLGARLTLSPGELKVRLRNKDLGHAEEILEVGYAGDTFEVEVNPDLLVNYMQKFRGGDIILSFGTQMSPILVHSKEDPEYLGVVMPMAPKDF